MISDCRMRNAEFRKQRTGNSEPDFTVEHCVNWLKVNGFEVLCTKRAAPSSRLNHRITIRTSPLCDQLEGAVRMYSRGPAGEKRYYVAIRFGCEVRWTEIPPHPPLTKGGSVAGGFGEGGVL